MSKPFRRITNSQTPDWNEQHRFEHWLVDNQVYFITARCHDKFPAFKTDETKSVFWDRFYYYTALFSFIPWVTSLLDNHYHTLEFLKIGENLPKLIQRLHGSVAKLVNDILEAEGIARLKPFWRDAKGKEYFDGCLRDDKQGRHTYRYTLTQSKRHGITSDHRLYPHTIVRIEMEIAIARANEIGAFLNGVPYKRYMRRDR